MSEKGKSMVSKGNVRQNLYERYKLGKRKAVATRERTHNDFENYIIKGWL